MLDISKELRNIQRTIYLLAWDERTYMPEGGVKGRSEMRGTMSQIHHRRLTSDKTKKVIEDLSSKIDSLDDIQAASLREMKREFERKYLVPDELINRIAKAASEGQAVWEKAREKSDFDMFLPNLKNNVELRKEYTEYIDYENEPYDALLDIYDPGSTTKWVEKVFKPMKKKLSRIVDKIEKSDIVPGKGVFDGNHFSTSRQHSLCRELAEDIGFDFESGRIDEAVHPFTIGMDYDVRITNRYDETNLSSLYSLMHEAGHGMYEQGIDTELYGTPIGRYISMGFHESQSRLWENFVGRSLPFVEYMYPSLQKEFPDLRCYDAKDFYNAINRVKPSYIRVEADEVTYNLHIALRFDIELGLFRDEIEPEECEVVWQNKMEDYLGISPDDPALGVLQDIHWAGTDFGYFPSYALGNLYAAQLYDTIEDEISSLEDLISEGEFSPLLDWLQDNIYRHGRRYLAPKMLKKLTSEDLSDEYLIDHIKDKYSKIYGISL